MHQLLPHIKGGGEIKLKKRSKLHIVFYTQNKSKHIFCFKP